MTARPQTGNCGDVGSVSRREGIGKSWLEGSGGGKASVRCLVGTPAIRDLDCGSGSHLRVVCL